jgi:cbb3-type cytochrome oxidase maturation protein
MSSIYLLIPLSQLLLGVGAWAFFWAVNNDQFDDLDAPARSVLDDDPQAEVNPSSAGPAQSR